MNIQYMNSKKMFWKFNLINISHIQTLLKKENVTLKELMDEDDILQECKAQTEVLINYLIQPEILDEMVTLITEEPPEDSDEKLRFKYANIACEILTSDVGKINNAIATNEVFLSKLYSFMTLSKPLNPLLASFFSKTLGLIITKNTEILFEFLKTKEDFVPLLMKHFDTSAIMDILLRFVSCIEDNEVRIAVIKWLDEQKIIQQLVSLLGSSYSEDYNGNAAHALCDIIKVSRERMSLLQDRAGDDPLFETLESISTITLLLETLFAGEKKESSIVNGITVLLALLEYRKQGMLAQQALAQNQSPQNQSSMNQNDEAPQYFNALFYRNDNSEQMSGVDIERLKRSANNVLEAVVPFLGEFKELLVDPPKKNPIKTTIGLLDPPLGASRLEVAHFHNSLLATNSHNINLELAKMGTIPILLDLFFQYPWNNFLHTQVEQCIARIFNNSPTENEEGIKVHPLLEQLFIQCDIIQKGIQVWIENEKEEKLPGKHRRGYMGHLTKLANHIAQNIENEALIKSYINALPGDVPKNWETFVSETLAEINKMNTISVLTSIPIVGNDDITSDFKGSSFAPEPSFQQFGFADDEFVDTDENLSNQMNQLEHSAFNFSTDSNQRSAELFEQACRERSICLGEDTDDVWEEKEQVMSFEVHEVLDVSTASKERRRARKYHNSSSDSEEENTPQPEEGGIQEPLKMDIDPWSGVQPMDTAPANDPWETNTGGAPDQQGWADFSNASLSFANFEPASETPEASKNASIVFTDSTIPHTDSLNSNLPPLKETNLVETTQVNSSHQNQTIEHDDEGSFMVQPLPPSQESHSTTVPDAGDATIQQPKIPSTQESMDKSEFGSPNGPV